MAGLFNMPRVLTREEAKIRNRLRKGRRHLLVALDEVGGAKQDFGFANDPEMLKWAEGIETQLAIVDAIILELMGGVRDGDG